MAGKAPYSIGVIVCSTRKPRIGPAVTTFVLDTIASAPQARDARFTTIDLAAWDLPFFDEPKVPSMVASVDEYTHSHTRRWSAEIARHDAFVFVTPQYNYGYPAAVKNAIDFLFLEWTGKPALLASYGGHGGDRATAQLQEVLKGMKMRPAKTMPALAFGSMEVGAKAFKGEIDVSRWEDQKPTIVQAFAELVALLEAAA